jgi:ubiquinone biosynthesis protein COQ4
LESRRNDGAALIIIHWLAQPEMNEIIRDRYLPPVPNLDTLLKYPENSLGHVFASNLRANNFDPIFYRQIEVRDDITYITLRCSQTHDIHHIITGFGTDLAGEIGLQAFELAQMRSPLAIALLTSGIVHTLNSPTALEQVMNAIHRGWQMGVAS